jgi:hypothetical protein
VTIGNINTIRYAERRIKGEDVMDKKEMMASKDVVLKQDAAADEEKVSEQKTVKKEAVPEITLQYREYEANMDAVTERVKAHYYAKGHAQGSIESLQIYVKPEDFTAYYVINDGVVGKVNLF